MKTPTTAFVATASALALLLASCDSKQEQAREESLEHKAENLEAHAKDARKAGEAAADMKEDAADAMRKSSENAADAAEDAADATRKAAEKRADDLEKAAEATREQK